MNPQRLTVARIRRGLTKKGLAERLDVSPQIVSHWEMGRRVPSEDSLHDIASALDFPLRFFFADDLRIPEDDSVSFRSLSRMTAQQRHAARSAGAFAVALNEWLEARFSLPDPDIPDLGGLDPESAAEIVRTEWGLGERPIKNVVHLLESRGVRIFSLSEDCVEVDAFSFWDSRCPIVLLNTKKSAERSRFDAAHELGHLVLHRHGAAQGRTAEQQANEFASAFLMPQGDVRAHSAANTTIRGILEKKARWRVSAMAYAVRLRRLNLLSDWAYHSILRRMAQLGYRKNEPKPIKQREDSQLLRKTLNQLRSEGLSIGRIAEELLIDRKELEKLTFGLALTGLQGGRSTSSTEGQGRANLRLVKG